jgi:hypothetical protein
LMENPVCVWHIVVWSKRRKLIVLTFLEILFTPMSEKLSESFNIGGESQALVLDEKVGWIHDR